MLHTRIKPFHPAATISASSDPATDDTDDDDVEDLFASFLPHLFPDEAHSCLGNPGQSLVYSSPLYGDLVVNVPGYPASTTTATTTSSTAPSAGVHGSNDDDDDAVVTGAGGGDVEESRRLFAHYLWGAAVVVADAVEEADGHSQRRGLGRDGVEDNENASRRWRRRKFWSVAGQRVLEFGAGESYRVHLVAVSAASTGYAGLACESFKRMIAAEVGYTSILQLYIISTVCIQDSATFSYLFPHWPGSWPKYRKVLIPHTSSHLGAALPSIVAAHAGAHSIAITDHPSSSALYGPIQASLQQNFGPERDPDWISIVPHEWGVLPSSHQPAGEQDGIGGSANQAMAFAAQNKGRFTRIICADCLWMRDQHQNLVRSILWFLAPPSPSAEEGDTGGVAWVVAGFHTGRPIVASFFETAVSMGLVIEDIWERDMNATSEAGEVTREWSPVREGEGPGNRARWCVVAFLRKKAAEEVRNDVKQDP
jgi:predicted nicotinamide N-methyase